MPGIEHVVVLMFENRSFDHLLGLLSDDETYPGVRLGDDRYSNPVDPTDPGRGRVRVTDDATFRDLAVDPPHSHASAVEQLGLGTAGGPTMDGFVSAYSRKLAGDEAGLPVVHWNRLLGLGGAAAFLAAGVLALPWAVPLVAGCLALVAVLEAGVACVHGRRRTLPVRSWTPAFAAPAAAVAVGGAASAVLGRFLGYGWRLAILAAAMAGLVVAAIRLKRRQVSSPPPVAADDARRVMGCMRPHEQAPALAALASSFALCTRWHCSVPGATWPNRNFAHAGTSDGTVDIELGLYDNDTIFQRLDEAGATWRIYRHPRSLAQVMAFGWLTDDAQLGGWRRLEEFAGDVADDSLPSYSFLEPCHDGPSSNSQHPGNNDHDRATGGDGLWDFERGENLIIEVYEALRRKPDVFAKTLLLITYDEHGGLYDHVPPPTDAVEPEPFGSPRRSWMPRLLGWFVEQPESRFRFNVLGPRVPTVIVSPRVPSRRDDICYDHAAIPRTLRSLFAPDSAPLSAREAASPSFDGLASLPDPRTDLPDLSPFLRPARRPRAAAEPAPSAPPEPPSAPRRDDDFARQLGRLGTLLDSKLDRDAGADRAGAARAPQRAPAAGADPAPDDVAARFTARAEAARRL